MLKLNSILDSVGNTPMLNILVPGIGQLDLKAKLESFNPTGSVKDRAASYILKFLLEKGTINQQTTIIESSSGNFGVALAAYCKKLGLNFICVVDPYISNLNESLLVSFGAKLVKVNKADANGGYLLSRIAEVKRLCGGIKNSYWVNQYENPYNAAGYESLGKEICESVNALDYLFIGVGSGSTIAGVSLIVKKKFPNAVIVAVDAVGSIIFGTEPRKRSIPGLGSSMTPKILSRAIIDEVIWIDEPETILACHQLLEQNFLLLGGSSGSVFAAVKKYFLKKPVLQNTNVVAIFPDTGTKYLNTVYKKEWCDAIFENHAKLTEDKKALNLQLI